MSSNLPLTQALYNLQEQQAIQLQQQHDALIREVQQAQVSLHYTPTFKCSQSGSFSKENPLKGLKHSKFRHMCDITSYFECDQNSSQYGILYDPAKNFIFKQLRQNSTIILISKKKL